MVSDQFLKDYRQMVSSGVAFTPEDIIRLNALAVRMEHAKDAASTVHLPRLAYLPKVSAWRPQIVLREPTIAHDIWLEQAADALGCRSGTLWLFLHAFALSRRADDLPNPFNRDKTTRLVSRFAARRLSSFTTRQLVFAVEYALFGAAWTACETACARETDGEDKSIEEKSPTLGLLSDARSIRLPITLDDARRMTASELEETIRRCLAIDHRVDPKDEHKRLFASYVRTRDEIRMRNERRDTE